MRCVIITVAGRSERFNKDAKTPGLKCIFYHSDKRKTLLYSMLKKCTGYEKAVIVGGYQFGALKAYIGEVEKDFPFRIEVVYNPAFSEYGSGYSLFLGIEACLKEESCSEILFAEGDLAVDAESFEAIKRSPKSCFTVNGEDICSDKSVIVYINHNNQIRYRYDTSHGFFVLQEPFCNIYNSGQIWKMADRKKVKEIMTKMPKEDWYGTNLVFIEKYFNSIDRNQVEMVRFRYWVNCNLRSDFEKCEGDL